MRNGARKIGFLRFPGSRRTRNGSGAVGEDDRTTSPSDLLASVAVPDQDQHRPFSAWLFAAIPAAFVLLAVFALPLLFLATNSFHPSAGLGQVGARFTLENYVRFLGDYFYWQILLRTFWLGAIVVGSCLILGYPVAYFVARMRGGRLRGFVIFLIISPLLISTVVRNLGWFPILGSNGLINWALGTLGLIKAPLSLANNFTGVAIGLVHALLPFMILSITVVIQQIDLSIEEASASLGARPVETFWRVLWPLSRSGVLAGGLLVFTMTISAYTTPAMLGGNRVLIMSTYLASEILSVLNYAFGATAAVVLIVVTCGITIPLLRGQNEVGAR